MANVMSWFKQKTTGIGLSALLGVGYAYMSGQIDEKTAIAGAIFGVLQVLWPEETAVTKSDVAEVVGVATAALGLGKPTGFGPSVAAPAAPVVTPVTPAVNTPPTTKGV